MLFSPFVCFLSETFAIWEIHGVIFFSCISLPAGMTEVGLCNQCFMALLLSRPSKMRSVAAPQLGAAGGFCRPASQWCSPIDGPCAGSTSGAQFYGRDVTPACHRLSHKHVTVSAATTRSGGPGRLTERFDGVQYGEVMVCSLVINSWRWYLRRG